MKNFIGFFLKIFVCLIGYGMAGTTVLVAISYCIIYQTLWAILIGIVVFSFIVALTIAIEELLNYLF